MERVVAWSVLCELIAPSYQPGNDRSPVAVERLLRLYFLQHWFNLSDPAIEEALPFRRRCAVCSAVTAAASRCPARRRRVTADVGAFPVFEIGRQRLDPDDFALHRRRPL